MADFPSFSLGLGLSDGEEEEPNRKDCDVNEKRPSVQEQESDYPSFDLLFDEEELDFDQIRAPDPYLGREEPRPFKRLRRGSYTVSCTTDTETPPRVSLPKKEPNRTGGELHGSGIFSSPVDDIEEFSSQEEPQIQDGYMRSAIKDASSCSKISLRNQGVLTSQPTTKFKANKVTPNSISSTLSNLEKSDKTKLLPKLTISPLRKIHVLDTDSDSDNYSDFGFDQQKKETKVIEGKEKSSMATPVLDEFCKEYFGSKNDLNATLKTDEPGTSTCSSRVFDPVEFTKDFEDMLPKEGLSSEFSNKDIPCYKYFDHYDARISALVRERLPHFTPIGMINGRANGQNRRENFDYMQQVNPKETAKSRQSKIGGQKDSTPTDAGRRRVQACGKKAGHWLTQDGKKIYVTKDGKEMTGQLAYRQYRRESGAKFRKGKGKTKKQGTGSRKRGKK